MAQNSHMKLFSLRCGKAGRCLCKGTVAHEAEQSSQGKCSRAPGSYTAFGCLVGKGENSSMGEKLSPI